NPKARNKSQWCVKTVADLIAVMRGPTPVSPSNRETTTTDRDAPRRWTPDQQTSNPFNRTERNDNLRLLLENYEVFVPKEDSPDDSLPFEDSRHEMDQVEKGVKRLMMKERMDGWKERKGKNARKKGYKGRSS
ncbi:hypothetical protein QZH41_003798, partial [Actinostola sp. cb2023]